MIERGNPTLSADSVSAASVFRADVVRHEIEEGERRNRERGAQAAARLADLLPKAGAR